MHCMASRHRGASGEAVLRAILQRKDLSQWMMRVVRATKLGAAPPFFSGL